MWMSPCTGLSSYFVNVSQYQQKIGVLERNAETDGGIWIKLDDISSEGYCCHLLSFKPVNVHCQPEQYSASFCISLSHIFDFIWGIIWAQPLTQILCLEHPWRPKHYPPWHQHRLKTLDPPGAQCTLRHHKNCRGDKELKLIQIQGWLSISNYNSAVAQDIFIIF